MEEKTEEEKKAKEREKIARLKDSVKIIVGEHELKAEYRKFKSGKMGYGVYGVFKINNWPCRLSLNLIEM